MEMNIGLSSYYNSKWIGIFYPESVARKKWFEFYCEHFSTYELNATFYRFPTLKSLLGWYEKSPDKFIFSVKAPKTITHLKKFIDCKKDIDNFYAICSEGLGHKLGCFLFQLPPSFTYSFERLQLILSQLDNSFLNVIEFRHESWWLPEVYAAFTEQNISFCNVNYPKLPKDVVATNSLLYIRMHGNPKLFYSEYDTETLQQLASEIIGKQVQEAFVYFNNTAGAGGILNALQMKKDTTYKPNNPT
jgi:uncharacterized protein YecE (DUF72 family)